MTLATALAGIDHHLWSSEPDVAQFLACLIRMHGFRDVVEVGVFKGLTACHLIDSLGPGGRYVGIDIEDHRPESVREYMTTERQTFLLGDSLVRLRQMGDHSADLIFLDGDHSLAYVRAEFLESLRVLKPRGIVCIHDYHSRGVRTWVDYLRHFSAFETLVLGTSENRGLAVVIPKNGVRSASTWFQVRFAVTRNPFMLRVREKLASLA